MVEDALQEIEAVLVVHGAENGILTHMIVLVERRVGSGVEMCGARIVCGGQGAQEDAERAGLVARTAATGFDHRWDLGRVDNDETADLGPFVGEVVANLIQNQDFGRRKISIEN